jgi:hypothetical protein
MPTEFPLFESGLGGDFATFVGETTGSIYRASLDLIFYAKKDLNDLLAWAIEAEGGKDKLRRFPDEVKCKICGHVFKADRIGIDCEEMVEAYEIK